ncbi:MAG: OB-fold nucleic acid binding domain-containing protein, partial [Opitutaceae bacterium]|nr:OB-fold nucleic acid binding domain-containing protein [Verrucomicrobiales bacterium]
MGAVLWLLLSLEPASLGQTPDNKSTGNPLPITDVASVLALPRAAASGSLPVKIRGVITCFERSTQLCFVQDASAGIFVYGIDPKVELSAGSLVEINGVTDAGRYSPIIKEVSIRLLGQTNLPPARLITVSDLRAGTEDAQWIQMRGVVLQATQTLGHTVIEITSGQSRFQAHVLEPIKGGATNIVDALVSIQGVAGAAYDAQGKISGFNVYVPNERFLEVIRRRSGGLFESPRVAVADLAQYANRRLQPHRVLVQGTVTARRDNGVFYLRDASGSIEIQSAQPGTVSPGDIVEAAGFPGEDPRRQVLREAMFRKTGMGTIPLPIKLSPTAGQTGTLENELISFEGTLLGSVGGSSNQLSLLLSHGNQSVTMTTERAQDMPVLTRIPPGSILRVEGIWHLPDPDSRSARSLQLWLPSAAA